MTEKQFKEHLAKELEGGLFVHVFLSGGSCGVWFAHKDYYTVKDGEVYIIEGGKLHKSGDSLERLHTECKRIGKYNRDRIYSKTTTKFSYGQIKKALKL